MRGDMIEVFKNFT